MLLQWVDCACCSTYRFGRANLPEGVELSAVRSDAAGYQVAIIDECMERQLKFAIRAKMRTTLKQLIQA